MDGERLRNALDIVAGGQPIGSVDDHVGGRGGSSEAVSGRDAEELDAERVLHDRHRNLSVAATGTGKAVIAALDRRLVHDDYRRGLTLLFVAHRKEILTHARRMYQEVLTDPTFGELQVGGEQPAK